ncbi:hypothetical protein [Streptomyces sp. NPDC059009]|uniref:hypothetical protein n=1 Tax=Streptomyces sp. NPDC059009 TaxID=3346694 RepID=UPI0036BF19FD
MTSEGRFPGFQTQADPVPMLRTPVISFDLTRRQRELPESDPSWDTTGGAADQEAVTPTLVRPPTLVETDVDASLDLDESGDDLLEDARANIAEGNYALAAAQLEEFLDTCPDHPEARYLLAYCHYCLGGAGQMEALRILRPLRDEPLDGALRASVDELRSELRRVLTPAELHAFAAAERSDPRAAAGRIRAYIELAPEEPAPPYLLAESLARMGELEQALSVAESGAQETEGDRSALRAFARELRLRVMRPLVAEAVAALRHGGYARARRSLRSLDPRWRETDVLRDFDAFLTRLLNSRHDVNRPLPAPRVPEERAEDLYSLIAEDDGRQAAELLGDGQLAAAEQRLARALHLVPRFAWLNFLYAYSLYLQGHEPDRAVAAAEIAVRDPSLTQASDLLQAVREMREALAINPLVAEYVEALEAVRGEITSEQIGTLEERLKRLRTRLARLRQQSLSRRGAEVLDQLAVAIDRQLAAVADATAVRDLYDRYDALMRPHQSGLRTLSDATVLAQGLNALATTAGATRRRLTGPEAAKPLDALVKHVSRRLEEIKKVRASLEVGALVQRFNRAAERQQTLHAGQRDALHDLLRNAPDALDDLLRNAPDALQNLYSPHEVSQEFAEIARTAQRLKQTVKGRREQQLLRQMLQAIDRFQR